MMETKNRKESENTEKRGKRAKNDRKMTQEQIAALKIEKKKMQEELDELRGNTVSGKAVCTIAFIGILGICLGLLMGMIKFNVGKFSSDVLAPVVGGIPVVQNILPADLQQKTSGGITATEQVLADTGTTEVQATDQAIAAQVLADEKAATEAANQAAAQAAEQALADEEAAKAAEEQKLEEQKLEEQKLAEQKAAKEAALADYVDTYSSMKPKTAAKVFDNIMKDQSDLVVEILSNMSSSKRAAIISNMSVANASQVTVLMKQ